MNSEEEVKYIPPLGAADVNSIDEVANTITPLWLTAITFILFAFLTVNKLDALPDIVTAPVLLILNGVYEPDFTKNIVFCLFSN